VRLSIASKSQAGERKPLLKAQSQRLRFLLATADVCLSGLVFVAALALTGAPPAADESRVWSLVALGLLACLAWPLSLEHLNLYASRRGQELSSIASDLLIAGATSIVLLGAAAFLLRAPVSPVFPLLCGLGQLIILGSMRFAILGGLRWLRRRGKNYRQVLVIGSGPRAHYVEQSIEAHPEWGLRLVGFVDDGDAPADERIDAEMVHKLIEVPSLLRDTVVDEVIVACPRSMLSFIGPAVDACGKVGVPITLLSDLFGDYLPPPQVTRFDSLAALSFAPVHHGRNRLVVKRAVDLIGAGVGLVLAAPVILCSAIAILCDTGRPVFFGQTRCGLNGRRFRCWKLRTMCVGAEKQQKELAHLNEMQGPVFKITHDPRVTRVGRLLRRWSLDELPQLWNVFVGDMSIVGPRPPVPSEVEEYGEGERRRISMRPGLTCLWQVNGRNRINFEEWVKLDLEYIDSWSLRNDFRIILRTIPAVFRGTGAS
jgi:exopolysaccharide biosynthesis polyprenyl glycosylphosphotransferase